ncbi:GntR family transcriptional regulator [Solwaraspora sp. WMMB762]|uniref:GntR family transcriptional regulator n=1 Tax=Solwaraspora sp. WMMB762 TaxID=3404120 RepID=UPI003B929D7B
MIEFRLDRRSGVTPYLQLVQQVRQAVRLGWLQEGDRLPTAREVVAALGINQNTVHKAYRELERDGVVQSRPGVGTFVLASLSARRAARDPAIRTQLAAWVATARAAGLDDDDLRAVLAAELAENASPRTTDDQPGRTG